MQANFVASLTTHMGVKYSQKKADALRGHKAAEWQKIIVRVSFC